MTAQPNFDHDVEVMAESWRKVARAQKRAEKANREAAQEAARARDQLLEFIIAAGVKIELQEEDPDNDD